MKSKNTILTFILLLALTLLSRFTSHIWNLTILGGVTIFAGWFFEKKSQALWLVFLSLIISDLVLGFYPQMLWNYGAYLLMLGVGFLILPQDSRLKTYGLALLASTLFFFVSNFSVWIEGLLYPMTWSGLVNCYLMGVPFFKNQLLGDLLSFAVFYELARVLSPRLQTANCVTSVKS